jgi:CHAT domain-containing protein/Flp pilus assembly protein TadD
MDWKPEEDNVIRRYLLDDATMEERRHVEERLLEDDEYGELLLLIEGELIDDYASGAMSEREQNLFRRNFLLTPQRRESLAVAQGVTKYAAAGGAAGGEIAGWSEMTAEERPASNTTRRAKVSDPKRGRREQGNGWMRELFHPEWRLWKVTVYALLILGPGLGGWWLLRDKSETEEAMAALNQAYREQRPLEARITGFGYAPFPSSLQRGRTDKGASEVESQRIDYTALDRAKVLLFKKSADGAGPVLLQALGKYYLTQKDFNKAIDQLRKAVRYQPESAQSHSDLGAALLGRIEHERLASGSRRKEDVDEAFIHLNQALRIAPTSLEALFNRALLYQGEGLRREARDDWNRYLQLDPNSSWSSEARDKLAEIEKDLDKVSRQEESRFQDFLAAQLSGDDDKAFESFSQSYSFNGNYIIEKLVDGFLDAKFSGRVNEAGEKLHALFRIASLSEEKTGDRFASDLARFYRQAGPSQLLLTRQARGVMAEANRFYQNARNDLAVEKYERARFLFDQAGNIAEALFADAWVGHCHHQRSDTEHNLQVFTRLAPACEKRKYLWMEANAYCGLANGHNSSGMFSQAIKDCLRCGEIAERLGDQTGALRSRYMIGYYYYELGKHEENLRITQGGLELADRVSADVRYAIPFYNLQAWSLSALGFPESALAFQGEAVKMAEGAGRPRLTAYAYIYQSLVLAKHKKFDEAIASAQRGIEIGRGLKDDETGQDFVHTGLLHLGRIYHEAGNFTEALAAFNQVIEFFRRSKKQAYFYGALKGRLLTLIAQGNDGEAREELNRVILLYETYRKSIQEESNRNSFFDQEQGIYDVAIDFAFSREHDAERAFEYSEIGRARSLLDESHRGWDVVGGPEAPDLQIPAVTQPVGAGEIIRQMPDRAQLLEYAVLDDKVIVWLLSKTGLRGSALNISRTDLSKRVESFLAHILDAQGGDDHRWREDAYGLHDILVQPVESLLDKEKQLFIIADKALAQLPYGALISRKSNKLLIEDYLLSYASSANMFLGLTRKARAKADVSQERLLAVGNPEFDRDAFKPLEYLPSAAKEVKDSAAFYEKPVVLTGPRATKGAVMAEMERADVVHLAAHYAPDRWSPMLSQVPLAGEKEDSLHVYELYQLRSLRPRLVVLSACQTRAGESYGREGAMGVSRPFEAAGIPLVVASLWAVDTLATSDLMIAFHRARRGQGRRTIEALKIAQLEMLGRADKYRQPYYWAAFIAVGGYSEY